MHPALAILELGSIARGVITSDAAVKRAPVTLLWSRPVSSGKHLVAFAGEVAEVEESLRAAQQVAGDALIDALYLPYADAQLWPLLSGDGDRPAPIDAVGVVETDTVCAAVRAADAAAKTAPVTLLDLRLAVGIGGKAFFTLTGELPDVEAAVDAARGAVAPARILGIEIVPAPHDDLRDRLLR